MFGEETTVSSLTEFDAKPFRYIRETNVFDIGRQRFPVGEFTRLDFFEQHTVFDEDACLYLTSIGLVGTPKLYKALPSEDEVAQVRQDIVETMIEVYEIISGEGKLSKLSYKPNFHMGFNVGLYRPGHPAVNVLGDCACMGVIPEGLLFDTEEMEAGFMEFTNHNVDTAAQLVSLYAGLGRIGVLCE